MNTELKGRIHACAPHESITKLKLYFELVKSTLRLDSVSWMAAYKGRYGQKNSAERKTLNSWLAYDMIYYGENLDPFKEKTNYVSTAITNQEIDPLTSAALASVGTSRALMFFEHHSIEDLGHWSVKLHESFNVQDRMLGIFSFGPYCESILLADRKSRENRFTEDDKAKLLSLVLEFPRVHYWLMLERGLTVSTTNPLTISEKRILQKLLIGYTDKHIAFLLGLEVSTVRSGLTSIYRKSGVTSRVELILLWYKNLDAFFPGSQEVEEIKNKPAKDYNQFF